MADTWPSLPVDEVDAYTYRVALERFERDWRRVGEAQAGRMTAHSSSHR